MEIISQEIISQIIGNVAPTACSVGVSLMLCEVVYHFFMRLAFPKQFIKD